MMQKETSTSNEEGSDPTSNREKFTFRTQATEENPRKKINLFDPHNLLSPCTSNVAVKPTILSSLKPSQDNFSFNWPPPFRQSQYSCNPKTQEAIKTMENDQSQQKVLDLDRKSSFSDSSPDIIKNPPEFIKPATTPPLFLLDPVAAPKRNENIATLTNPNHPLSRLPSGESVTIGCSAPKPEPIRGYNYAEALRRRKCAKVLRSKEEEAKFEALCDDESKKKTAVVGSNGGDLGVPTRTLQFKCKCGRVCEFVIF